MASGLNTAIKWYQKAAEQGLASAQVNLGQMYDSGKGVVQDHKTAFKCYRSAADQEDSTAHHNLGVMYKNGRGVVRNYKSVKTILSARILLLMIGISVSARAFGMVTA